MAAAEARTPVTMLSGFLGSGKTTLLRYLLENSTERIACIVNDVAAINIDAKLVRNDRNRDRAGSNNTTADLADTIELANGCACCNLQDELFASFERVLALGDKRGQPYARIVLENSGVAEPQSSRDNFAEAAAAGHPLMGRLYLDTLVTVVDASTFVQDYASRLPLASRPELGDGGSMRPVVDLLVEQVECADFVLLNKADLAPGGPEGDGIAQLGAIVASLNPLATVLACTHGKVDLQRVFGGAATRPTGVVAHLNTEGQHRGAVAAAKQAAAAAQGGDGHGHPHGEADGEGGAAGCSACEAGEHGHDHSHKGHSQEGHSHDHAHEGHGGHAHGEEGHECGAACAHGHEGGGEGGGGGGPAGDHPGARGGHSHHHHHHHHGGGERERAETRAAKRFGIRSFVYNRRRPFHPQRLREMVLRWLPVSDNRALAPGELPAAAGDSPVRAVIRSKGFMWMASSHATAYYWSHAGMILSDFAPLVGDRRQEIVFIGVGMDESKICAQLDGALLTDEECRRYAEKWGALPDPAHAGAPAAPEGASIASLAPVSAAAAAAAEAHEAAAPAAAAAAAAAVAK
ncbi:hypothetical protein Rsub_07885 [Raphidocelis subcapitata]|uniref:CobW C-terminal domain-containing protein n=1 Tax=Raphidocelis subcapitata TaxID=307507 RepID=A0A2V0P8A6_9CHLO|nr:hypothetical protein Rsub_07885 [Raphidocelis subcapitata]|eukprot:GBF95172.1 hypothetical protein Rsub_07885 [Raphidocelis subcapitata]